MNIHVDRMPVDSMIVVSECEREIRSYGGRGVRWKVGRSEWMVERSRVGRERIKDQGNSPPALVKTKLIAIELALL